ncbi:hypothetical protein GGF41_000505 [Coemansia sp. RSA 2531]|nr:hypothetical protein GGF41_000505 [Coemansia sp. RSA 2531]
MVVQYNPDENDKPQVHRISYKYYPSYNTIYNQLKEYFGLDPNKSYFSVLRVEGSTVEMIDDFRNPIITGATHVLVYPISIAFDGENVFSSKDNLINIVNKGMSNTEIKHVSFVEDVAVSYIAA